MTPERRERYEAKVDRSGGLWSCWPWLGAKTSAGYGQFKAGGRIPAYAHRLAYEQERGPIPHGMTVDHLCANRACVNPGHMEIVNQAENTRRGAMRRWHGGGDTHGYPGT